MDNRIKSFIELVASSILTNECVNGLCEFDSRCATKSKLWNANTVVHTK